MAPEMPLPLGQIVTALTGHDRGRCYCIVGYAPDGRLLLSDGRYRGIQNPKVKQRKHVAPLPAIAGQIAQKRMHNQRVFDVELRTALKNLGYRSGTGYKEDSLAQG